MSISLGRPSSDIARYNDLFGDIQAAVPRSGPDGDPPSFVGSVTSRSMIL